MKIKLVRETYTVKSTIGKLYIDGIYKCYTLEDVVRVSNEKKVFGATAIPAGTYKVIVDFSARFQQQMPLYVNVPGYVGVRLHFGNTDVDTNGCTLVGLTKAKDFIGDSRKAYAIVFPIIHDAYLANQPVIIEIVDTNK